MRRTALAASAALLTALLLDAGFDSRAGAQPAEPDSGVTIDWEVKNRFRLFRRKSDFQRHVIANRAGSQFAAEHQLERATGGRGWAQSQLDHLCVNAAGTVLDTCDRDGERENYLAPKTHLVVARLAGAVPAGATCNWSFDDGTIPPKQVNAPCNQPVAQRLAYGKPTIAAVGITRPDNSVDSVSAEIEVRDLLIAGMGDSVAAGEGNPDRPIALADEGFCFRRFLGAARGEYFRPSRLGYKGDKACDDSTTGSPTSASEWNSHAARWMSAACHRSLYGYQLRTALALATENRRMAVTFLPLACTGATIENGLFGSQGASDCPSTGRCAGTVPPQLDQLQELLNKARKDMPSRRLDLVLLTVGANDIKFSGLVADVIISSGVERTLFSQGGQLATVPQAQVVLEREYPTNFAKLRNSLKPLVGGNLSRVVYVSYGHPALEGGAPCPGGRDGLDIHPAFNADETRLKNVTDFVLTQVSAEGEGAGALRSGVAVREPRHRQDDLRRCPSGRIRRSRHLRPIERRPAVRYRVFLGRGQELRGRSGGGATSPLVCPLRPSEFRPYAPRARWIRTANDSYFTAMTYPRGLSSTMQPSNIHDASWAAMSAVYGGAFHPSAEGHAVMADAALPAAREALGLKAPPEVIAQPLPLPGGQIAPPQ